MYLPAINNLLIEDTKLIADAVAICCQPQRGHGVQEASWKNRAWSLCKEPHPHVLRCAVHRGEEMPQPVPLEIFVRGNPHAEEMEGDSLQQDPMHILLRHHKHPKALETRIGH